MREKKVNLEAISFAIEIGMLKIHKDLQKEFDKWPEDSSGTLVTFEQLNMGLQKLEDFGISLIENITGKLPDITVPIKPDPPALEARRFPLQYIPEHNRLFTWLPETGAAYGGAISLTICDAKMFVPDATKEQKGNLIWFPGTTKTGSENNNNRAAVFGPLGCKRGELIMQ